MTTEYGIRWATAGESFVSPGYTLGGAVRTANVVDGSKPWGGRVAEPVQREVGEWVALRTDETDGAA